MVRVLTWNVRGLREATRRLVLRYLQEWRVDLVMLQETHLEEVDLHMKRSIGGDQFDEMLVMKSEGRSSGQIMLWDGDKFHLTSSTIASRVVSGGLD
jgi:exonuclease III